MEKAVMVKSTVEKTVVSAASVASASQSSSSALNKRIEFHLARKTFNGLINNGDFKIETLNPDPGRKKLGSSGLQPVKVETNSDFVENGLDPELRFGITFRRIGAGLENLGNTCFLNSVLQCLTYTEPLAAYLQSGKHQNSCHISGFCALCAIQRHVIRALQSSGRSLVPKDLVSNLKCISRNFRNARQEDAHEYMVNLLESMHKCCLPSGVPSESPAAYEKSLVHKIFGGCLCSQVECQQCFYCSNKFDPFLDLSLEILKADSLPTAIRNFTAAELLDGGEKQYQCQHCKQKVRAKKRLTIHKAPHVLTIHLKRFHAYNPGQKVDKKVSFDRSLDMKPFVSGLYEGELKYSLYGVLVHFGHSTHSGHYLCFVRTSSGMWYRLNDNQVCQVNEKTVLDQKAYMLFYVRDRKNDSLAKPADVCRENLKPAINSTFASMALKQFSNGSMNNSSVGNVPSAISLSAVLNNKDASKFTASRDILKKEISCQQKSCPTTYCLLPNGRPCSGPGPSSGAALLESKEVRHSKQDVGEGLNTSLAVETTNGLTPEKSITMIDSKSSSCVKVSSSCNGSHNFSADKIGIRKSSEQVNIISDAVSSSKVLSPNAKIKSLEEAENTAVVTQMGCKLDTINSPTKPSPEAIKSGSMVLSAAGPAQRDCSQEMLNELVKQSTSSADSQGRATDCTDRKKLKKKHQNCQVTNLRGGLKFFPRLLGLRKKRLHKKVKRSALDIQSLVKEPLLGNVHLSSDLGPSTSETSMAVLSVSRKSGGKRSKSDKKKRRKLKKGIDDYSISTLERESTKKLDNHDGVASIVAVNGESAKADNQNGPVSSMGKQLLNSEPDHQHRKDHKIVPQRKTVDAEDGIMCMLSQGLEETTVARWDGVELPLLHIEGLATAQNNGIGYVLDEWDEEYDRGKRKKLRYNKHQFGGPNPFQELAAKNQFKRAKIERIRSGNQPFRI